MQQVRTPDGRTLEYQVGGVQDGPVLLFHHGTPGSGHQSRFLSRAATSAGLCLVTLSRAGYAASDRLPGRSVLDVVADSEVVLDAVGADRVLVAGVSGGGPHALACGTRPDRFSAALVVAGVAPYDADGLDFLAGMGEDNVTEFGLAVDGEAALRPWLEAEVPGMTGATAAGLIESMASVLPEVDRAVVTGELGEDFVAGMQHALSRGVDGWLDDDLAFAAPWGFDLDDVKVPVSLWQGGADLMVPFAHGEWLASRVPSVTAHLEPAEGHLSLVVGAVDRMLAELQALGG